MPKTKHGMHKTPIYKRWVYMKRRCVKDPKYTSKGITVCDEWVDNFMQFYRDMGDIPSPDHTLDRIDGTKGYSKDNCRWATYKEQNHNLSSNVRVNGEVLADIAARTGIAHNVIRYRVSKGLQADAPRIQDRTQCKAGHEWNDKNTYTTKVKRKQGGYRIQRFCRVCRARAQADLRTRREVVNKQGEIKCMN